MKNNVYAKQIPQISATGNDGEQVIHLKAWKFAESIEDLLLGGEVDDCGIMEVELHIPFNTDDKHLMNVLKNKEITHYCLANGQQFQIPVAI
jgi:hypothetical protein